MFGSLVSWVPCLFFARAYTEILDGAERLPAPICNFEANARGRRALRHLRELWLT